MYHEMKHDRTKSVNEVKSDENKNVSKEYFGLGKEPDVYEIRKQVQSLMTETARLEAYLNNFEKANKIKIDRLGGKISALEQSQASLNQDVVMRLSQVTAKINAKSRFDQTMEEMFDRFNSVIKQFEQRFSDINKQMLDKDLKIIQLQDDLRKLKSS